MASPAKPASPAQVGAREDSFQDFRRIPKILGKVHFSFQNRQMIDFERVNGKPATSCSRLIFWTLIFLRLIRTKPSPGEDRRVGWYCYRATQSRRSHLTYTHRKSSYRPKIISFGKKRQTCISFLMDMRYCVRACVIYSIFTETFLLT